jgi:hypothetical protein
MGGLKTHRSRNKINRSQNGEVRKIMFRLTFCHKSILGSVLGTVAIMLTLALVMTLAVFPVGPQNKVLAASTPASINMIYYGSNSGGIEQDIINAHPEFLVDNSPAGPWQGDANVAEYESAGIKYFEYVDGGYENTVSRAIPNNLQANLNYIAAVAKTGAYGIFLDEVSSDPDAASLAYLAAISNAAHAAGLKVVFNTGVSSWSPSLMNLCDYMNSSETWNNGGLTTCQATYGNRVWMETEGVSSASTAASLTEGACNDGILAEYSCGEYSVLPSWLTSYVSLVGGASAQPVVTTPVVTTTPVTTTTVSEVITTTPIVTTATNTSNNNYHTSRHHR